ncbi:MAG: response regulator transcription factor [Campylobacter sp.]|nr:response regulator transcription factor [Campylobacter sp.]
MKIVLFTRNISLKTLWGNYNLDSKVVIVDNEDKLFDTLNKEKINKVILGVDVDAPDAGIINFIDEITAEFSGIKILALANEPKFTQGRALLSHGIRGYANSHEQEVHLKDAVKTIDKGNVWLYPDFIQVMIGELSAGVVVDTASKEAFEHLSTREKEVANFIAKGMSNKQISELSGITVRTVKAHTASIYEKMGVKDRLGLVLAMKNA